MQRLLQAAAQLDQGGAFPSLEPIGALREVQAATSTQQQLFEGFSRSVEQRIEGAKWMSDLALLVGPDTSLFERRDGSSKMGRRGRARWIEFLADTLVDPAEVRLLDSAPNPPAELRLLGGYQLPRRQPLFTMPLFRQLGERWRGWSAYDPRDAEILARCRSSALIWVRK
jgi:hypothetical protein